MTGWNSSRLFGRGRRGDVFAAWVARLTGAVGLLTGDPNFVAGAERIRRAIDYAVRQGKPADHLDLGTEIAPEHHRLELDLILRAQRRDLHTVLAENQRAGRNADDV